MKQSYVDIRQCCARVIAVRTRVCTSELVCVVITAYLAGVIVREMLSSGQVMSEHEK